MNQKTYLQTFIFTFLLVFSFSSANAATDWGIKGVADTSKVKNVVQLTTNQAYEVVTNNFAGSGYMGSGATVMPTRSWSMDSQWIVFGAQMDGTSQSHWEICKIKPDGSSFQRLTTNLVQDSNANFSTNGKFYYNIYTGGSLTPNYTEQVWWMNQDGTSQENLSNPSPNTLSEYAVSTSPDGTKIAFVRNTGSPDNDNLLMVANANGSSPVQVSGKFNSGTENISVSTGNYSWSPDSMWLVYSGQPGSGSNYFLYKVKATGTDHTQLTSTEPGTNFYHTKPVWSPDNSQIVYQAQVTGSYTSYQLRTIDTSGNLLQTLDTAASNVASPGYNSIIGGSSWSPNSQWVAYTKQYYNSGAASGFTNTYQIWIVNVNNPSPIGLTSGFNDRYPIWSPNGSQILFQSKHVDGYPGYPTREDDSSPFDDYGDILVLNLIGSYGNFPWLMFNPAFTKKRN